MALKKFCCNQFDTKQQFDWTIINAFVFRKLLYCFTVWSNTSKTNFKRLQLVQNFAGKIVFGLPKYDHISDGRKSFRWPPIADKGFIYVPK